MNGHYICKSCGQSVEAIADRVSCWWMHDNHTFTKLVGSTVDEIISQAESLAKVSSYGMLCAVIVLSGDKELRRVGRKVHQEDWPAGLEDWRREVLADPDISRLLAREAKP